jgi:glycosyltransferase involved in cell wall biosynthesis
MMNALYISQTGMTEPLGRSQVLPYLRGLATAGWRFDLLSFEPAGTPPRELERLSEELDGLGISHRPIPRSASHSPAVKLAEAIAAIRRLAGQTLRHRPRIIHARSHLPAAIGEVVSRLWPRSRFIFDCRGLIGDEYVDAGHWQRDSLRYRVLKRAERHLFRAADAVVVLTDRFRRWLRDERLVAERVPIEVVPCCVDLSHFASDAQRRAEARARIGAGERFVLAYVGSLGSWYCEEEMAALFAAVARRRPAQLLVLSRSSADRLRQALRTRGVADEAVHVEAVDPREVPRVLSAADATVSLRAGSLSKIAASPVKLAESLALGIPTVMNRGIGDADTLFQRGDAVIDAGDLSPAELERCAERLLSLDPERTRRSARALAEEHYSLDEGVRRYRNLYDRLVS